MPRPLRNPDRESTSEGVMFLSRFGANAPGGQPGACARRRFEKYGPAKKLRRAKKFGHEGRGMYRS
jgi:hypothetical protein